MVIIFKLLLPKNISFKGNFIRKVYSTIMRIEFLMNNNIYNLKHCSIAAENKPLQLNRNL